MVMQTINLDDHDINECKELYEKLGKIINAYECLPTLEEIHSNSGNMLFNTSGYIRDEYFSAAFNELIIDYVLAPPKDQ